ncbi:MAG: chemotaxis protein CheB [Myxococcales bacterium]
MVTNDAELRVELGEALRNSVGFSVAGVVRTAAEATRKCQDLQPDVVVVDSALPADEGYTAVQDIMAFRPTPILMLAGAVGGKEAFRALAMGALDVMPRPAAGREGFARELMHRLKLLAGVRVIQHVRGRRNKKREQTAIAGPPVVGIAASLGGPRAVAILLKGLPRDLPAPVCLVQHISDGFVDGLTGWLASESGFRVKEPVDGEALVPGTVFVAPSGVHLTIDESNRVVLEESPAFEGFRPSATKLFHSLAQHCGPRTCGVVLTGMGRDGADGLLAIRNAGGRTLAQDEATSTVYGMPRAAVEAGAVERVVSIDEMASVLNAVVRELAAAAGAGR